MKDVKIIKRNKLGITYKVNRSLTEDFNKVHLVFNNTGLKFDDDELLEFYNCINDAFSTPPMCQNNCNSKHCKSILLKTPFNNLTFAISLNDLDLLKDLIDGTFFKLSLDNYLDHLSIEYDRNTKM